MNKKTLLLLATFIAGNLNMSFAGVLDAERWKTSRGMQVVFYPTHEVPMLDITIGFSAGSAWDGEHHGLSMLTSHLLDKGSRNRDATAIADALESTGAQYSAQASRTMLAVSLRTLSDPAALAHATATFTDILCHPDFPESAVVHEKNIQKMMIREAAESPDTVANNVFFDTLYHDHPYGHAVTGDIKTVDRINRETLRTFYGKHFSAPNAVMVVVGDTDSATAHRLAESISDGLPKGPRVSPVPPAAPLAKPATRNIPFPSSQTILRLGEVSITHHAPDWFPLLVGNYILGGGTLVSRLAIEVRDKRGLTYGVSSEFAPMPAGGPFLIGLSTRNATAPEALELTRSTLSDYIRKGPDASELKAAKDFLTGSFPLSISGNRNIASILLKMAFYELPADYLDTYIANIEAVRASDIEKAFKKHIQPDTLLTVAVGKMA